MPDWGILVGDVRETLATLPAQSVQCCVTSPPYWGLRDYGTATWDGGNPACDHIEMAVGMSDKNTLGSNGYLPPTNAANVGRARQFRSTCGTCGARRIDSQLGLEPTPDAYVQSMVQVFREVRRVLKDDGTLWLNLGDSYAANRGGTSMPAETLAGGVSGRGDPVANRGREAGYTPHRDPAAHSLKHKDLIGIPWRVAFALQADGWYLRSDIIWHKPNPMPESVTDRPTKSHEYIFLLTKQGRYYYDAAAIAEKSTHAGKVVTLGPKSLGRRQALGSGVKMSGNALKDTSEVGPTRNKRSVWTVATQPYAEAHFATFPEALIEPCILAGSRVGDTVLDPFTGSGTTGAVAVRHQRSFMGCELNPAYVELARRRIGAVAPLFAQEQQYA